MTPIRIAAAAAVLALFAAPAMAQPTQTSMQDPATAPATNEQPIAPAATASGENASDVVLQSSPTPPDQAYALKAGDPSVVSNAPVADTPANRARYGGPMSRTGKRTPPAGN